MITNGDCKGHIFLSNTHRNKGFFFYKYGIFMFKKAPRSSKVRLNTIFNIMPSLFSANDITCLTTWAIVMGDCSAVRFLFLSHRLDIFIILVKQWKCLSGI